MIGERDDITVLEAEHDVPLRDTRYLYFEHLTQEERNSIMQQDIEVKCLARVKREQSTLSAYLVSFPDETYVRPVVFIEDESEDQTRYFGWAAVERFSIDHASLGLWVVYNWRIGDAFTPANLDEAELSEESATEGTITAGWRDIFQTNT